MPTTSCAMRTCHEYRRCISTMVNREQNPSFILQYHRLSSAPTGTYQIYDEVDGDALDRVLECLKDAYANFRTFLSQLINDYEQTLAPSGVNSRISLEDAKLLQPSLWSQLKETQIQELPLVMNVLTTLQRRYPNVGYECLERAIRAARDAILMHPQQAVNSDGVNSDSIPITSEQEALSVAMIIDHFFDVVTQRGV